MEDTFHGELYVRRGERFGDDTRSVTIGVKRLFFRLHLPDTPSWNVFTVPLSLTGSVRLRSQTSTPVIFGK